MAQTWRSTCGWTASTASHSSSIEVPSTGVCVCVCVCVCVLDILTKHKPLSSPTPNWPYLQHTRHRINATVKSNICASKCLTLSNVWYHSMPKMRGNPWTHLFKVSCQQLRLPWLPCSTDNLMMTWAVSISFNFNVTKNEQKTRRRSEIAYICQVIFLQLLYRVRR